MTKRLDPRLIEILKEYGEDPNEALWDCHGTWVAYHKAIERIAAKAGVVFERPDITETDASQKIAVIVVGGKMGDRYEWSFGEAAPYNNKNAYPYAMAEKRAKDRVVLKLVGLHGLVYSEEESDDFKPQKPEPVEVTKYGEIDPSWKTGGARQSAAAVKRSGSFEEFKRELTEIDNLRSLEKDGRFSTAWRKIARDDGWADSILAAAKELIEARKGEIMSEMSAAELADIPLEKTLKHSVLLAGE
jgi:hypothetical protein